MENLPNYINVVFVATTLITIYLLYRAANKNPRVILILFLWMFFQWILTKINFYTAFEATPPRFPVLILPPVVLIISLFMATSGKTFIDKLGSNFLIAIHIVRIPVELVLYYLFIYHTIPQLMTFEGRNFDILSGITAVIILCLKHFLTTNFSSKIMILWNLCCLGLLFNIVFNAILSIPTPFQQHAFDQPNIAVAYFPFIWLPSVIVPIVLFAHLAMLRQLLVKKK